MVGVVLAGGESRRMGRDKALMPWESSTLAGFAYERLAAVCGAVVVCDRGRQVLSGTTSLLDGPGAGPAAGLLGAAAAFPGRPLLVLACDVPRVPVSLLFALLEPGRGADLVLPVSNRGPEPLVGYYGTAALAELARLVAEGNFSLQPLLASPKLCAVLLEGADLARFGDPGELFANVNSEADYRRARAEHLGF